MTMKNSEKILIFKKYLDDNFPHAQCELIYQKDYELAIAVVLSAQTTDKAVNLVTPILFSKFNSLEKRRDEIDCFIRFNSLEKLKEASLEEIGEAIRSIGLYRNKAVSVKGIAAMLADEFGGRVPADSASLLRLPGVGNKTRNVIQAELFNIPSMAVDTHVERISKRLGFAKQKDNPDQIETKLRKLLKPEDLVKTNHQIITFGREICHARKPKCDKCDLYSICNYFSKIN